MRSIKRVTGERLEREGGRKRQGLFSKWVASPPPAVSRRARRTTRVSDAVAAYLASNRRLEASEDGPQDK